jgi:Na+-driven multidrug efflux pump
VATVLSQGISAVLCLVHLSGKHFAFSVQWKKLRMHGDMLREIVRNGLPAGVQNSVIAIANVIVQSQINSFGKLATAAYGTYSQLEGFGFLPINSFAMAISPYISQNLGAKGYDRAKKGARFGIASAMILAAGIGLLFYGFAPQLIGLFDNNPGVIELGVKQARIATLFYGVLAFSHAVAAVCRGAGKAFVPMFVMLSVWCVLRIIYIMTMMRLVGEIQMIYWAYPITWSITTVIFLIYYLTSDWVHGFER